MPDFTKDRRFLFPAIGLLVLFFVVAIYLVTGAKATAYSVRLNDKELFVTRDVKEVKTQIKRIQSNEEKRVGQRVDLSGKITYRRVLAEKGRITKTSDIRAQLRQSLSFQSEAARIMVNSHSVVWVANQELANKALKELKARNSIEDKGEKLQSVRFCEKLEVQQGRVSTDKIVSLEQAVNILETGNRSPKKYTVKEGDSLWLIARRHDTHVVDIKAANNLQSENLQPGQEIWLTACNPYVNVTAVFAGKKVEAIPYTTRIVLDNSLGRQTKEKQKGQNGEKKSEYVITKKNGQIVEKKVLTEKVIKKPVERIVARGSSTRTVIASRGGTRSSGSLNWPLVGAINSYFGGGRGHTGIDIDGNTGQIIKAAKAGTVTFTGRSGNYGLMVTIDHGDGIKTRYAHCSQILVKKGERVSSGQAIAKVGSTGRSTGSHLHFEVLTNGSFSNPLKHLK